MKKATTVAIAIMMVSIVNASAQKIENKDTVPQEPIIEQELNGLGFRINAEGGWLHTSNINEDIDYYWAGLFSDSEISYPQQGHLFFEPGAFWKVSAEYDLGRIWSKKRKKKLDKLEKKEQTKFVMPHFLNLYAGYKQASFEFKEGWLYQDSDDLAPTPLTAGTLKSKEIALGLTNQFMWYVNENKTVAMGGSFSYGAKVFIEDIETMGKQNGVMFDLNLKARLEIKNFTVYYSYTPIERNLRSSHAGGVAFAF